MHVTQSVQDIAHAIVAREGGYVNDPDDPGGATKYGVTIHTMRRLGLDLTGDGRITPADVRELTREQAEEIFVNHYFKKPKIDLLSGALQASVFDMYVNAGDNAVKILQRMLVEMNQPVSVDGVIGPQTAGAVARAFQVHPEAFVNAYGIARRNYYYALADRRPASRKYARRRDGGKGGWITRAEEFLDPKYHLTDAEHKLRVARWS